MRPTKKLLFTTLLLLNVVPVLSQNIGINNPNPDPSALLDLSSTTQGLLAPRMTTAQRLAITSPAIGLLVYDTSLLQFVYFNGFTWRNLIANGTTWDVLGNTGTNPATNFLGTTDNFGLAFRTNSIERMRLDNDGSLGLGIATIDAKALLHISSTTKGVLLPRFTTAQRLALIATGSTLDASRNGLLVFDTNLQTYFFWNATSLRWDELISGTSGNGDYWALLGNTATNPGVNFIGTTDSTDLVFRTNGIERFRIRANGLFFTNNQGPGVQNIYFGDSAGYNNTSGFNNSGVGLGSLQANTTGFNNSALGSYSLRNNTTGYNNTGVGIESLHNNTTGYGNTSVGERSGYSGTTAFNNSSYGRYSLYANQIGSDNVAIGDSVLSGQLDAGNFNVAIGNQALVANNSSDFNVAIGYRALFNNTTGNSNVAIGINTLLNNTSGFYNIGVGRNAGMGIITGSYNIAVGYQSLLNARDPAADFNVAIGTATLDIDSVPSYNVGIGYAVMTNGHRWTDNVAIGYNAMRGGLLASNVGRNVAIGRNVGYNITTGIENVFIGYESGYNNNTASNNVFIGTSAGRANTTGERNVFIGNVAGLANTTGDENVIIGNTAGDANTSGYYNVFIGNQAGTANTIGTQNSFVGWWSGRANLDGQSNSFYGNLSGYSNTNGIGNTFIGAAAGATNTTGDNNTSIGWTSGPSTANQTNAGAFGYGALSWASNTQRFGDDDVLDWGFGCNVAAGRALQVGTSTLNGNGAYLTAGGTWTNTSDINLKEDITTLDQKEILRKINALPITKWKYKGTDNEYHIGPMAQDFYNLFKLGVDDKGISSIDPAGIALIGIKELSNTVDQLKNENEALRKSIEALTERLNKLEQK